MVSVAMQSISTEVWRRVRWLCCLLTLPLRTVIPTTAFPLQFLFGALVSEMKKPSSRYIDTMCKIRTVKAGKTLRTHMLWAFWHLLDLLFYFWGVCLFLLLLLSWYICKFPVSLKLLYNHPSYVWEFFRWLNNYKKMPMEEQISSRFYIPCVFSKGILFTCSGLAKKFKFLQLRDSFYMYPYIAKNLRRHDWWWHFQTNF